MFLFIYFIEFYLNVPSLFVTIGVNEMMNMARNSLNCCKAELAWASMSEPEMRRGEAILHPKIFPNIQKA